MLRGAIDMVQSDQIGGWIYSELGTVVDQTVLAFMDNNCVGSGRIGLVREDLKAAGLGDGRLGFNFPISVGGESDLSRIVVKLEGSDLALLQSRARVGRRDSYLPIFAGPERMDWLRRKGLLAPAELTFLRYLQQMSVFDHSLVVPRSSVNPKIETADARTTAQHLFDLLCLRQVELKELTLTVRSADDIVTAVRDIRGVPLPIVAVHSVEPGVFLVVEGSHVDGDRARGIEGAIEYNFGPDRLLFLDLNARFQLPGARNAPLRVFCGF